MSSVDLSLKLLSDRWLAAEQRWEVQVELSFTNTGAGVFELDKVTACPGGTLQNCVFEVRDAKGGEVTYQGMMRKRAHPGPEGFHKLERGQTHSVQVDLGARYAFPEGGGAFRVRFDHANHFSPDDVQLVSNPVAVLLTR